MTLSVGAYEAKTHLPKMLDDVEAGGEYVITKHGRPVAKLVPVTSHPDAGTVVEAFAALRRGRRLGASSRAAKDGGRR